MIRALRDAVRPVRVPVLAALLVPFAAALAPAATRDTVPVDRLLPEGTLFVISVDDAEKYSKDLESMPLSKVMREDQVIAFLEKPKEMLHEALTQLQQQIQQQEGFENFELSVDELMAGTYGRLFVALTHVSLPNPDAGVMAPDVGLILGVEGRQGAPDWTGLIKDLTQRVASGQGVPLAFEAVSANGISYEQLTGVPGGPPLVIGRVGDLQLFSLSTESLRMVMERAAGTTTDGALADGSLYRSTSSRLAMSDMGSMRVFMNVDLGIKLASEAVKLGLTMNDQTNHVPLVDKLLDMSGLRALKAIAGGSHSVDGVAHGRSAARIEGPKTGLLALSPDKPIDLEHLSLVPSDAAAFSMFNFDPGALYDLVFDVMKTVDEETYEQVNAQLAAFQQQIGGEGTPIDVRNDLFGNLGPEFVMVQPKSQAMVPSLLFITELRNGPKVLETLNKLAEFGSAMSQGSFSIKAVPYKESTIYQIDLGSEMPVPISPCFAESNGMLYISLAVGDLKRQMRRLEKADGDDIRANPDFVRFFERVPKEQPVYGLSYTDVKYAIESGYGQLVAYLPMVGMMGIELPFDMALLPTQDVITQHLFGAVRYYTCGDDGCVSESFSPIGGEAVGMLAAAGAGVGAAALLSSRASIHIDTAEAPPPLPPTEEQTPTDEANEHMSVIWTGLTIYKLQGGEYPDRLDQLLEPSESYPKGCLGQDALPIDPWGNPYHYERTGAGYVLWSSGPDGVDNQGSGDDVARRKD